MSRIAFRAAIPFAMLGAGACTHQIQPTVAPVTSFYKEYQGTIPGRFAVFIQSGTWAGKASVSSWQCGAHSYAFDSNAAFQRAVMTTLGQALERPELVRDPIPQESIRAKGYVAQVAVHTAAFKPQVAFQAGFMTAKAIAAVEATIQIVAMGPDGVLFQSNIQGTGQGVGPDSGFCGGGDEAVSQAINGAAHQIMDRLGERIDNSPKLREAATEAAKSSRMENGANSTKRDTLRFPSTLDGLPN